MLALVATPFGDFLGLSRTPEGPGLPIGWRIRPVRGSPPPSFAILEQGGERVLRISGKGAAAWAYLELKTPIIALGVMQDTDQTNSRASAEVRSIGWSPR